MYQFSITENEIVLHLRARLAGWAQSEDHRAHLLGAYNTRISEVTKVLAILFGSLETEANARKKSVKAVNSDDNPEVLNSFRDLTYRLAEMYDFLRRLPDSLDVTKHSKPANREYNSVIRKAARTACLICNKIKHNDHVLGRRDNYYDAGFYVEGFVLMSRGRDANYQISRDLHDAKKPGISFNLGIRGLVFDFLRADIAAGHLCSVLGAEEANTPDSDLMNVLRIVNDLPEVGLDFERAQTIAATWEQSGYLCAGMKDRKLPFLGNKVSTRHFFRGDGFTKTFPIS